MGCDQQPAVFTVDEYLFALRNLEQRVPEPEDERDAKRAGDDCGVSGWCAAGQRQAGHELGSQLSDDGCVKILRGDDHWLACREIQP